MPFKKGEGRQPYNLTENDIRYAQENSRSARGASRFLRISYEAYKRYAQRYIDTATGKTLFDLHKNQSGRGMSKTTKYKQTLSKEGVKERLQQMLDGKLPITAVMRINLKKRLIQHEFVLECCSSCGFNERRVTDDRIPLLLDYIDGNKDNISLENLRLLCYNCYFLEVSNIRVR
jgi:hypothetical protein